MASILRYCVAGPKKQYFTGTSTLDMAYITPNLIVCSMPTSSYIKGWYRMWLADLLEFLDEKHRDNWRIWNLQSEATGYGDEEVFGRIEHFPFPDHNPPPFELLPRIVKSIDKYIGANKEHVAVLHCKAGKGRSGTVACAYLMIQFRMTFREATEVFTKIRMRPAFGQGISILSQRRYLKYLHDYVHLLNQQYHGIEVQIEAVKVWHQASEDIGMRLARYRGGGASVISDYEFSGRDIVKQEGAFTVLVPGRKVVMPADVCVQVEHSVMVGRTIPVVHSSAYMWFNAFFEVYGSAEGFDFERNKCVMRVSWRDMDGFKGTHKRGSALFDRLDIYCRVARGVPI